MTLSQNFKIINILAPAADAAGRTGAYISAKNAGGKVYIVCKVNQANAATVALTLQQASAVAGTGAKALTGDVTIFTNQNTAATDLLTKEAVDAKAFTTSAGTTIKIVVFEIDVATALDINNGFDCITVLTGASNVANITEATAYVTQKYQGIATPSMIVD